MSRTWVPRTNRNGIEYGGVASVYYWTNVNPGASYENCLANCTTLTYGRILENGDPPPTSGMPNAGAWPWALTNGWTYEAYSPHTIRQGDILCWESQNHVAVIEGWDANLGVIYCSHSYYTGDHGVAYWNGHYDYRTSAVMGNTMLSVCNWMIANYPDRFYHYGSIYDAGLGTPEWILRNPNSIPDTPDGKIIVTNKRKIIRRIRYV